MQATSLCAVDSKAIWKILNEVMKRKKVVRKICLIYGDIEVSERIVADRFNEYFTLIADNQITSLPIGAYATVIIDDKPSYLFFITKTVRKNNYVQFRKKIFKPIVIHFNYRLRKFEL